MENITMFMIMSNGWQKLIIWLILGAIAILQWYFHPQIEAAIWMWLADVLVMGSLVIWGFYTLMWLVSSD